MHLYLYAMTEHASDEQIAQIHAQLDPPDRKDENGVPRWYGSDEDAWAEFERQL